MFIYNQELISLCFEREKPRHQITCPFLYMTWGYASVNMRRNAETTYAVSAKRCFKVWLWGKQGKILRQRCIPLQVVSNLLFSPTSSIVLAILPFTNKSYAWFGAFVASTFHLSAKWDYTNVMEKTNRKDASKWGHMLWLGSLGSVQDFPEDKT